MFEEILEAVGYTSIRSVSDVFGPGEIIEYWVANLQSGSGNVYEEYFLYISRECTLRSLDDATASINLLRKRAGATAIVASGAESLRSAPRQVAQVTGVKDALTIPEFVYGAVGRRVLGQARTLVEEKELGIEYFVEPDVNAYWGKEKEAALEALESWLGSESRSPSNVAVLVAPAATGKTTVAKKVFYDMVVALVGKEPGDGLQARSGQNRRQLSKSPIIPVLVTTHMWARMIDREPDLEDIWAEAAKECYPGTAIGPEQLKVWLEHGAACLILDGFDELCSLLPATFDPADTIGDLVRVSRDGRVLITSRDRYWNEHIPSTTQNRTVEFVLRPFSHEQRDKYIRSRFPDNVEKQEAAHLILERLGGKTSPRKGKAGKPALAEVPLHLRDTYKRLDTIPYIVMLAAESADTDQLALVEPYGDLFTAEDPLYPLLLQYSEREKERQQLQIEAQEQVEILGLLAAEYKGLWSLRDAEFAISYVAGERPIEESTRFQDHGLLTRTNGSLTFRYSFVHDYLVGRCIYRWLLRREEPDGIERALAQCAHGSGSMLDYCSDLILGVPGEEWKERTRQRVVTFSFGPDALCGLTHVVMRVCKDMHVGPRQAATSELIGILGEDGRISNLHLWGMISDFDFCGVTFDNCTFNDLEFVNCVFDESSRFTKCKFKGRLLFERCDGDPLITWADNHLSPAASSAVQVIQGIGGKGPVTRAQIREATRYVLRRFRRGEFGVKTRNAAAVKQTIGKRVPFAESLLEELEKRQVLRRISLKGRTRDEIYQVEDTTAFFKFLREGAVIGSIKDAEDELFRVLG